MTKEMTKEIMKEPLLLRVRANGELDNVLRAIFENGPLSREELIEAGGLSRSRKIPRLVQKWFDNVRVDVAGGGASATYVDIAPKAPISIGADVVQIDGDKGTGAKPVERVQWPQAPPLIEEMENFRKPSWFETMRTMVKAGRHISLESPPGMGKDTAIQQLAAEEGMPLVTVSGDGGFRRRDLVGTIELADGSSFFQVAEYAAAAINGWWVLITEVNAAAADALLFINNQLAPPYVVSVHGKAYPVHPNFRLFVSYNAGLIGTKPLPPSFKDRFFPIKIGFFNELQLRRRLEAWGLPEEWERRTDDPELNAVVARSLGGRTAWADRLVKFGILMWEAHEKGQMRYQISVRRLIDVIKLMELTAVPDVWAGIRAAVIATIDSPIEAKVAEKVLKATKGRFVDG